VTAFQLAERYLGIQELPGDAEHPLIQWWLSLCRLGFNAVDETPWCSAFVNGIAWELRQSRSYSAAARSWLAVGTPVRLFEGQAAQDVVILSRGPQPQPGPAVTAAPGHVGFFAGVEGGWIRVLGGNQGNAVSIAAFPVERLLGLRRI